MINFRLRSLEDEILPNRTAVCIALRTLVEECTVILGHCYSPKQVEETKRKQKILMNEAIKKILPGLDRKSGENEKSSHIAQKYLKKTSILIKKSIY